MNFFRASFPNFLQLDAKDCGPVSLQIISKYYGKYFDLEYLREICGVTREGISVYDLCIAAETLGFKSTPLKTSYKRLCDSVNLPCILHWEGKHFVVLYKINAKEACISDPAQGIVKYPKSEFAQKWLGHIKEKNAWRNGVVVALEPSEKFKGLESKKSGWMTVWRYLSSYIRPYSSKVVYLLFAIIVITAIQSIFPFITQSIVDIGITSKDIPFIHLLVASYLLLTIFAGAATWVKLLISMHIGARVKISMLSDYMLKFFRLPLNFFENKMIGDVLQRVIDYDRIEQFLMSSAFNIILSLIQLIVFGAILSMYDSLLFTVFLGGSIVYLFWIVIFWKMIQTADLNYFSLRSANFSHIIEMVKSIGEIKNNNYEMNKRWEWEKNQVKLFKTNLKLSNIQQIQSLGTNFIASLRDIMLTYLSACYVMDGKITIGMMVSVQYLIGQLKVPVDDIANFYRQYQIAYLSFMRLNEVNQIKPEQNDDVLGNPYFPENKEIEVENLSFRYTLNDTFILKNINCSIPQGKITAIVGKSGSGKSTFLKILLRLYNPTAGILKIGNQNFESISIHAWRDRIAVVTNENSVFRDTMLNNITLKKQSGDAITLQDSLRYSLLEQDLDQFPLGLATYIGESGRGISSGQRQRILLARAFYKNPEFFFLDEATSALDSESEKLIMDSVRSMFPNTTIIATSHRLSAIKRADQILVLHEGAIVESGTHESLIRKRKYYYNLFKDQLDECDLSIPNGTPKNNHTNQLISLLRGNSHE